MARKQIETGCWQCISREDTRVWAFCQTRGYQRFHASTFQVRHLSFNLKICNLSAFVDHAEGTFRWRSAIDQQHKMHKTNRLTYRLSFCSVAFTSMSEPRGQKTQPTSQNKAVRWVPAQCTTWHTACTSSTTGWRLGVPLLTRSAHRDTDGGVDLFQRTELHWG